MNEPLNSAQLPTEQAFPTKAGPCIRFEQEAQTGPC
ncbi:hypothetical protein V1291_001653 [Nitrobacteraceae bacterium AZCC 1564]